MGENLNWILIGLGILLLLLPFLIGFLLSPYQQATRVELIKAPADDVWTELSNIAGQTQWRTDLKSVQMLDDDDGLRWVEQPQSGSEVVLRKLKETPSKELLVEMQRPGSRGTREARLNAVPGGTRVTFTEMLESQSPLGRIKARMSGGLDQRLDTFIRQLQAHFTH